MRPKLGASFVLLAGAGTWSCLPWPHFRDIVPAVEGRVVEAGVPRPGLRLRLADDVPQNDCRDRYRVATTDAAGGFAFEGVRRLVLIRSFGDPLIATTLCLETESGPKILWSEGGIGYEAPPVKLACTREGCQPAWCTDVGSRWGCADEP